jgi:hypothetical protein
VYASTHSESDIPDDVVPTVVDVPEFAYAVSVGKRRDAVFATAVTLGRAVTAKAAGITAKTAKTLTDFLKNDIPILHILLFYFNIKPTIWKVKNWRFGW